MLLLRPGIGLIKLCHVDILLDSYRHEIWNVKYLMPQNTMLRQVCRVHSWLSGAVCSKHAQETGPDLALKESKPTIRGVWRRRHDVHFGGRTDEGWKEIVTLGHNSAKWLLVRLYFSCLTSAQASVQCIINQYRDVSTTLAITLSQHFHNLVCPIQFRYCQWFSLTQAGARNRNRKPSRHFRLGWPVKFVKIDYFPTSTPLQVYTFPRRVYISWWSAVLKHPYDLITRA